MGVKPPMVMRSIRVPAKLWDAAKKRADEREEDLSAAIRRSLERYALGGGTTGEAEAWDRGASEGLRTPPHLSYALTNPYRTALGDSSGSA